ncbi:MAG: hypothetical protein Q8Q62_04785, partial [Mesorhizobium sp.]|nr:hypothetical protein [Mesorhizobium sp.]
VAKLGEAEVEQTISIEADKSYAPQFVLDAGTLKVRPLAVPGGEPVDSAAVNIVHPRGETTSYGAVTFIVPAGAQELTVRIGEGQAVEILKAAKKIDGSRDSISTSYGPDTAHDLPAGDYVMVARMQDARAEAPFSIKVGERTEASVVLNAGVAAISAPGASKIEVVEAKTDIQGKRRAISLGYGETYQTTLPAGDYIVMVERNDVRSEAPMTVKAGERVEINIE